MFINGRNPITGEIRQRPVDTGPRVGFRPDAASNFVNDPMYAKWQAARGSLGPGQGANNFLGWKAGQTAQPTFATAPGQGGNGMINYGGSSGATQSGSMTPSPSPNSMSGQNIQSGYGQWGAGQAPAWLGGILGAMQNAGWGTTSGGNGYQSPMYGGSSYLGSSNGTYGSTLPSAAPQQIGPATQAGYQMGLPQLASMMPRPYSTQ